MELWLRISTEFAELQSYKLGQKLEAKGRKVKGTQGEEFLKENLSSSSWTLPK